MRFQPAVNRKHGITNIAGIGLIHAMTIFVAVQRTFRLCFEVALVAGKSALGVHPQVLVEMFASVKAFVAIRFGAVIIDDFLMLHRDVVLKGLLCDKLHSTSRVIALVVSPLIQRPQMCLLVGL